MAGLKRWTCSYGGLVIGAQGSAVQVSEVDGLLSLPDVRSADLELVQRHGLWAGTDYMGGRSLSLTLQLVADTPAGFSRAVTDVQAAFSPTASEKAFSFVFPGVAADAEAFVMVRPRKRSGVLTSRFVTGSVEMVVELFATDPYIYADQFQTITLRSAVRGVVDGGLSVPFTVPFTVERSSPGPSDPMARFFGRGSVPARPTIEFQDALNPIITDDVTGDYFGIAYSGSRFTVDSAAETVTDSDGNDITSLVSAGSTWPEFRAGDHRLRLRHGDPFTEATAVLSWQDRWV